MDILNIREKICFLKQFRNKPIINIFLIVNFFEILKHDQSLSFPNFILYLLTSNLLEMGLYNFAMVIKQSVEKTCNFHIKNYV